MPPIPVQGCTDGWWASLNSLKRTHTRLNNRNSTDLTKETSRWPPGLDVAAQNSVRYAIAHAGSPKSEGSQPFRRPGSHIYRLKGEKSGHAQRNGRVRPQLSRRRRVDHSHTKAVPVAPPQNEHPYEECDQIQLKTSPEPTFRNRGIKRMPCELEFSASHSEDDGDEPMTSVSVNVAPQQSQKGEMQTEGTVTLSKRTTPPAKMQPAANRGRIPVNGIAGTEEESTMRASIMDHLKYLTTENEVECLVKLGIYLNEQNMNLLERVVLRVGTSVCQEVLEETLAVEANGGQQTAEGRRRTPGGVFLKLLRDRISPEDKHFIWLEQNREQRRRKRQRSRYGDEHSTSVSKHQHEELQNSNMRDKISVGGDRRDSKTLIIQEKSASTIQEQQCIVLGNRNNARLGIEKVDMKDAGIKSGIGELGGE